MGEKPAVSMGETPPDHFPRSASESLEIDDAFNDTSSAAAR
jgi:hypothetical protein